LFGTFALALAGAAVLLVIGIGYEKYGLRRDRRKHLPTGRLITLGDRRLHIHETGDGEPLVVFESGLASSSLSWSPVQQITSRTTRSISYDRAGIGWSDETRQPRTVVNMVNDLRALLTASGNPPPYILVGHSFGALLARAYASIRTKDVAGLVLIDPVSLDMWADCSQENQRRLRLGAKLARRGVVLANVGVVRLALTALGSGRTRLPQIIARASAGRAMGPMGRLTGVVRKLPSSLRSSVQSHWSQAKSFRVLAEYLEILRHCAAEVRAMTLPPNIPLTILSAATATSEELEERERWISASVRGRHRQIADSGHWIQVEHPEHVASAVLELVEYLRESANLQRASDR
jgi:pimeloyl-ACP methyl ester carboxylesterase